MSIVPKTFYDDKSYFLYIDPSSHVISQSKTLKEKSAEKTVEKVQFVLATDYQPWLWTRWSTGVNEVGYCANLTRAEAVQVCHYIESTFTPETAQALGIDPSVQRVPRPITLQERIFCRKTAYIVGGIAVVVIVGVGFYKLGGVAIVSRIFTRFFTAPQHNSLSSPTTSRAPVTAAAAAPQSSFPATFEPSKEAPRTRFPVNWKNHPASSQELRSQGWQHEKTAGDHIGRSLDQMSDGHLYEAGREIASGVGEKAQAHQYYTEANQQMMRDSQDQISWSNEARGGDGCIIS